MDKDYKKLYEDALKRATKIHSKERITGIELVTCEEIFPELKESEDEKIRKGLIKGLSAMRDIYKHQTFSDDAINIDDAIAWLEKQGEQNPSWSEEDEKIFQFWNLYYEHKVGDMPNKNVVENLEKFQDWLKSLKNKVQHNYWKPSEEQLTALKNAIIGKRGLLYDLYFDLKKL